MEVPRGETVEVKNSQYDEESLVTSRRKLPGASYSSDQNTVLSRTASSLSTQWRWSVDSFLKWTPSVRKSKTILSPVSVPTSQESDEFLFALTGERFRPPTLEVACQWYTSFLESKIRESWVPLFRPVLINAHVASNTPNNKDLSRAFKMLTTILAVLEKDDLALIEVVDKLYNGKILEEADPDRSQASQLIFAALGWITLLYCPEPYPEDNLLQIVKPSSQHSHPRNSYRPPRNRSKTFTHYQQSVENMDFPLDSLLRGFGEIIPEPSKAIYSGCSSPLLFHSRSNTELEVPLLCFQTLNRTAGIKIELVDCLALHLEFDRRRKILKIFRFPSLCLIMYCSPTKAALAHQRN